MVDELETFGGSFDDVRAFCSVVELGSISAAARLQGVSKGGVSRRVSRLEKRLGVSLLARTSRAVTVTEEGSLFFARAREALRLLDDAAEAATAARLAPRGHLRVTAPVDFGLDVLPAILVRYRRRYPQMTVELLLDDAALDLAANRIDLALRATPGNLPDMGYRASRLIDFEIKLYASPRYLQERGELLQPADLAGHDFVGWGGAALTPSSSLNSLSLRDRRGREENLGVSVCMRSSDYASVSRLVAEGGGIAAIPAPVAVQGVAAGRLVCVLPQWHVARARMYAISLGGAEAPARVRSFRDFLRLELEALVAPV